MRPARPVLVCAKIELASDTSCSNLDLAWYLTDTGAFPSFEFFLNCELTISNTKGLIVATYSHPMRSMLILKLLHQPTKLAQASADKKTDNSLLFMSNN